MDERFLDRVLRTIPVAQDEPRDREQPVSRGRREDLEGLVIAAPCLFHEIALHRISTGRAAEAALTDYDARWPINRSRIGCPRPGEGVPWATSCQLVIEVVGMTMFKRAARQKPRHGHDLSVDRESFDACQVA